MAEAAPIARVAEDAKQPAPKYSKQNSSVGGGGDDGAAVPGEDEGPPPAPPLVIAPNGEHVLYKHVKRPESGVWDAIVGVTVDVKYESQRQGR